MRARPRRSTRCCLTTFVGMTLMLETTLSVATAPPSACWLAISISTTCPQGEASAQRLVTMACLWHERPPPLAGVSTYWRGARRRRSSAGTACGATSASGLSSKVPRMPLPSAADVQRRCAAASSPMRMSGAAAPMTDPCAAVSTHCRIAVFRIRIGGTASAARH